MKAVRFASILEEAINQVRQENGVTEKVKIVPCDVVQICANGRHKDVVSGQFVK